MMAMGKFMIMMALSTSLLLISIITQQDLVCAQTVPSVPQFTLEFVDKSYDYEVQPVTTSTMDPYTGVTNSTTKPGYTVHVENKSVIITIRNQLFFPSSQDQYLLYAVRVKGHYLDYWGTLYGEGTYRTQEWWPQTTEPPKYPSAGNMPKQSGSEYSVFNYSVNGLAAGSQIDFQVQAVTGYDAQAYYGNPDHPLAFGLGSMGHIIAVNQRSGWSETQTITVPSEKPSSSPTLAPSETSTPAPTESSTSLPSPSTPTQIIIQAVPTWFYVLIAGLVLVISVLLGSLVLVIRRIKSFGRK